MKSLTLFRHAKTERDSTTGRDFDRRLIERGQQDSRRMGQEMRTLGLDFDLVVASPAARAAETAEFAGFAPRYDERIYDASSGELLAIVQGAPEEVGRLAMVGHNPGFERLASRLIGQDVEMPTGSVVEIGIPVDHWADVGDAKGRLIRFVRPKDLR
jgi:phosphohistidine phosphatase